MRNKIDKKVTLNSKETEYLKGMIAYQLERLSLIENERKLAKPLNEEFKTVTQLMQKLSYQ